MSFPKVTTKQYRKCRASRLGSQFLKRLAKGLVIDRTQTKNPKNVKTVKAHTVLTKFFTVSKEAL